MDYYIELSLKNIIKFIFIIGVSIFTQVLAEKLAFVERGYEAMGGELFVFPFMLILLSYLFFILPQKIFNSIEMEDEDDNE